MKSITYLKETKDLGQKILWIFCQAKPILPFLAISVILSSLLSLVGVYNAILSKSLIDAAIGGDTPTVIKWLLVMISISLGKLLLTPITSFMSTHASTTLSQQLQARIYNHIVHSEWLEQSKFHSVSLLTRITSDVGTITRTLLGTIPNLISLGVTLVASFSTLIYFAPSIALVAVFIGPILLIISRLFAKKLKILYKQIQEEDVKYKSFMQESIQSLMIVKTFCMEQFNLDKLKSIQKDKYHLAMKNTKLSVLSSMSMSFCSSLAYFTIFCWGVLNISTGLSTYGTFTAMLQLYSNIQGPFSALAGTFPSLVGSLAATERLMEIESLSLEDSYLPSSISSTAPTIEFKDVSFKYTDNCPVLNHINLTIHPGETIAFVGPSGQGKTTLIRLILSLISSLDGEILLHDNHASSSLNRSHRELISYVPQGNTLFSGTIRDNLIYGKADATEEELVMATHLACAAPFISHFENGLDTLIGEKGSGVSEGQAQRLCIARALLRKKPILILDEATSSLDSTTELHVLRSIKHLDYKPTCIIITHRPSALSICDRVFKLEDGYLTEVSSLDYLESNVG